MRFSSGLTVSLLKILGFIRIPAARAITRRSGFLLENDDIFSSFRQNPLLGHQRLNTLEAKR
ncbi:hypothetical protein HMPREF0742_01361 [Rothia aeria F0184]|uniref:Uncharacterized protein n=1 Tax=Rothia aeria F0184 TaxID=888019 RepID=U7V2P6_9MICC|nr:hypothetical protein HMPREF0742_01361 [Rothia aeria F0184]